LPELLAIARQRALNADEASALAEALRDQEPWLEWAGKREARKFEVDPIVLQIHERISTKAILKVAARQDVERSLFADPQQAYHEAVQFYRHDIDWTNRLILGDSLQVMSSLARREDLAGKVQMIYMDPPYGIKFKSNFQPLVRDRNVKDRELDLTREPEMVKAYRDTWHLGVHSYLTYLRDRLVVARELLTDSGSIFVQIGDENLHLVRAVLDEVFGRQNQIVTVIVKKKGNQKGGTLDPINDYLLWYARDRSLVTVRPLFVSKISAEQVPSDYNRVELPSGEITTVDLDDETATREVIEAGGRFFTPDQLTSGGEFRTQNYDLHFEGRVFNPAQNNSWKLNEQTMMRVVGAGRVVAGDNQARFRKFLTDFGNTPITNLWGDLGGASNKVYSVQTNTRVLERCILATTDPGDLVLDPTCGSGTTAYVAEQWGRRWITIDTSRVSIAIARQRLLTAKYDYYQTRTLTANDEARNQNGTWLTDPTGHIEGQVTFKCKTVPHVTLKSIAQNTNLDSIFAKHEPVLEEKLAACNVALARIPERTRQNLTMKLMQKQKAEGRRPQSHHGRRPPTLGIAGCSGGL
jgi:adenine-specific DNA-methyltransferase